jgi:hypothetical protein
MTNELLSLRERDYLQRLANQMRSGAEASVLDVIAFLADHGQEEAVEACLYELTDEARRAVEREAVRRGSKSELNAGLSGCRSQLGWSQTVRNIDAIAFSCCILPALGKFLPAIGKFMVRESVDWSGED